MREKEFVWHLAPGFTVHNVIVAFRDHGVAALQNHDEISVRPRKGWKRVRIRLSVEREPMKASKR